MTGPAHSSNQGFRVDINDWIDRFDLLALAELVRREANLYDESITHVPCDVIVFGYGPAPSPDMTRVGGLPYRPSGTQWPKSGVTGKPLTFVCQVRVKQSFDILGSTPGEVMLLFAEEPHDWSEGDICAPVCEWQNANIPPQDLVRADEIPPPGFRVPECYGLACRFSDILTDRAIDPVIDVLRSQTKHKRDKILNPVTSSTFKYIRAWICQSARWKIGGGPYLDDPAIELYNIYNRKETGRFLMNISAIPAAALWRFAWLNCENEEEFDRFPSQHSLDWLMDGSLHLYLMNDGSIRISYSMMS